MAQRGGGGERGSRKEHLATLPFCTLHMAATSLSAVSTTTVRNSAFASMYSATSEAWIALMKAYGALPASILIGAGLALGLAVVVLGWSGAPARPRPAAAA